MIHPEKIKAYIVNMSADEFANAGYVSYRYCPVFDDLGSEVI